MPSSFNMPIVYSGSELEEEGEEDENRRMMEEVRKKWEEEDGESREELAQINSLFKSIHSMKQRKPPKLQRGDNAQRRRGGRRKQQNGGRSRSRSVNAWRRKRKGGRREKWKF